MASTDYLKNIMLDSGFTSVSMSLHTSDPNLNGANEVTGGSYARQSLTYSAAVDGEKNNSQLVLFDGLPSATITHVGFWYNTQFLHGAMLTSSRTVESGDSLYFAISNIRHIIS